MKIESKEASWRLKSENEGNIKEGNKAYGQNNE
jgi:hypothetical protein